MTILIVGLVLFLGIHSARIVADHSRSNFIAKRGAGSWKGLYSVVSALGLVAIIWGYSAARQQPTMLWAPLPGMKHVAALLTLLAFILLAAAYVPGNALKARLHHPMVLAVKLWALGHLLANNTLADLLLFGGFFVWAVFSFRAARQRDQTSGTSYPSGRAAPTVITAMVGLIAWAVFALWLHAAWIGVRPFG